MTQKLIEVNYGLASSYEGFTEIHHLLVGDLRQKILKHENRHKADRHYTKEDFMNDFQSENSYFFESLKFAIIHPECLVGFMPFMYSYYAEQLTFNKAAMIPFGYFGLIFSAVITATLSFLLKFNIFYTLIGSILGYSAIFCTINALLMLISHKIVKKQTDFVYKEVFE